MIMFGDLEGARAGLSCSHLIRSFHESKVCTSISRSFSRTEYKMPMLSVSAQPIGHMPDPPCWPEARCDWIAFFRRNWTTIADEACATPSVAKGVMPKKRTCLCTREHAWPTAGDQADASTDLRKRPEKTTKTDASYGTSPWTARVQGADQKGDAAEKVR